MHWINMQSAAGERISNASQLSVFVVWQMFKLFGLLYSLHTQHSTTHTHTQNIHHALGYLAKLAMSALQRIKQSSKLKLYANNLYRVVRRLSELLK